MTKNDIIGDLVMIFMGFWREMRRQRVPDICNHRFQAVFYLALLAVTF